MLPSRSTTSAWALHCLAPSQRGRVPPSHLVSVLWHDLPSLPLAPHQQKHLLLMSEASEDPRPDSCRKLSTHSLSYGTWDSTIKDRCFQVQEAFQYPQVLCGSTGALRGGALAPHFLSQSGASCALIPSGQCQAGVRLSRKPEVVERRVGKGLRQEME